MECIREGPVRARHASCEVHEARRHQSGDRADTYIDNEVGSEDTLGIVGIDDQTLTVKLFEQEGAAKSEKMKIERQLSLSKEKVARFFENLRDLLTVKENELLEKVDIEYDKSLEKINEIMSDIENEKARLQNLQEYGCIDTEDEVQNQVRQFMAERENTLEEFTTPDLNMNEDSVQAIKNLSFGEFIPNPSEVSNAEDIEQPNVVIEPSGDLSEDEDHADVENALNLLEVTDSPSTVGTYDDNEQHDNFSLSGTSGATGYSEVSPATPSAPFMPVEDPPPPYWQAVGRDQPQVLSQAQVEIPAYDDISHTNRLPENIMHVRHSFPVRRQHDRKGPFIVAMTWNHGRICITDRANMKVKFFYPNGTLVKEMQFLGYELYDVTFLEEVQGEAHYLLTCPKSKLLVIISISFNNIATVVKNIETACFYTCVCRGPEEQTLVGTEVFPKNMQYRLPSVHVFKFSGEIITNINLTPSFVQFVYPKALEVFQSSIVVLDWKLNSVCVYLQDGSGVGEYRGTHESPLIHPLHMTLDQKGNIMILNGDIANIHVIDIQCNPLEVIKIPKGLSGSAASKLIAFDAESCRLCLAKGNGELAVFKFQDGYDTLGQRNLGPRNVFMESVPVPREPSVLPLVEGMLPSTIEGMLPSTIESIASRSPGRNRNRQFHL